MTLEQVSTVSAVLDSRIPSYVSVFAGRIADTGRNPVPIMKDSIEALRSLQNTELIWASPRELLNIFQADEIGCHVITATNDILQKLDLVGRSLEAYSLETVQMFRRDSVASQFNL
jgi:transaldolase